MSGEGSIEIDVGSADALLKKWQATNQPSALTGSAMSGDNKRSLSYPMSTAAWFSIVTGVQHFDALLGSLRAGTLDVMPSLSVSRGALLGAGQAIWLLSPWNRTERLDRLASQRREDMRAHKKFADLNANSRMVSAAGASEQVLASTKVYKKKQADRAKEADNAGRHRSFTSREIIECAAKYTTGEVRPEEHLLGSAILTL
ncbi:hypothetical protein [Scrofimicrobium sp. R131]|uniref:Uncharacterized protein n=1 Tax=Scrofimicrobium appendicitidis TaxID=3079930 RepID=A0AAU7V8P1_9ACTO